MPAEESSRIISESENPRSLSNEEMAVRNVLSAPLRLTSGTSMIRYRNILPERYSITVPFRKVVDEKKGECKQENQLGDEVLFYDRRGHLQRKVHKGLFLNTYL